MVESSQTELLAQHSVFNLLLQGVICHKAIFQPMACSKHCLMEVDIFHYLLLDLGAACALMATDALKCSIHYSSQYIEVVINFRVVSAGLSLRGISETVLFSQ